MNFRNISAAAIRNPIPTILLFVVLTLAGVFAYGQLRINNFPDVDLPVVGVTVAQPGAAPVELETQVTRYVEDAVSGLGDVKAIRSSVNDGVSSTTIEFQLGVDPERATNDVRNAVAGVRAQLPGDITDPIVQRFDFTGFPILNYVVRAPGMSPEELSWYVDNTVAKRLLSIRGVAQVQRDGGVEREIRLRLDPERLAAYGLTAGQISQQLRSINANVPGGRADLGGSEQAIRTLGAAGSVEELRATPITLPTGATVRLEDLGTVEDQWTEPRGRARFEGQEVVGFGVMRSKGSSEVDVARAVEQAVRELDAADDRVTFEEVTSTVEALNESYLASVEALLLGAALAVVVVWVFLRDLRATFIAAVAMPLSLIPTFAVMQWTDQSLNVVTLLALSLTVGILVDDAIVEIENIVRHMREGKKPYPAAIEAADEIGLAVVATTAVLLAVFAPVGFMPGVVGQFFKAFAIAACVSVFFSLVVARLLTPLMGAYLLKDDPKRGHDEPRWMPGYLRLLRWAFERTRVRLPMFRLTRKERDGSGRFGPHLGSWNPSHRTVVVLGGVGFLVFSILLAARLPGEFIPAGDVGRSVFTVELPPGSTLEETDATVQRLTRELKSRPEVRSVYASIGSATVNQGPGGGASAGEVRRATVTVNLKKRGERDLSQQEFERSFGEYTATLPGARVRFGADGNSGALMNIMLVSDDPVALQRASLAVEREMRQLPELRNVFSVANLARPELLIRPKTEQAARLGVQAADIAQVARVATLGDVEQILPKYNLADRQIPIRVSLTETARADLATIENLRVPTATGATVPLSAVADVGFGSGPQQIDRYNRLRSATIQGELNVPQGVALEKVRSLPSMQNLPANVREQETGDVESQRELGVGFMMAIVTGIVLMYVVLVLLFRSFSIPITILTALPLSFGGAFLLLLLTGRSLSMPALIGLIMLTGIAAKNSILLVEYVIEARARGMARHDAVLDAAHKRARPIIMTSVAMGAGMLPIALGLGADVAFRSPMAIAVIGGLITSTLLSLIFVPVAYTIIDDLSAGVRGRLRRLFAGQGKDEDVPRPQPAE
jgi:HAE1 family hydrophobic/amphiphilic exporter-1